MLLNWAHDPSGLPAPPNPRTDHLAHSLTCPLLADPQEQFAAEKNDLLDDYRQLTREIKLKNLIIACFIPPEYQDQIMQHCHFDDYDQSWTIDCIECAGELASCLTNQTPCFG